MFCMCFQIINADDEEKHRQLLGSSEYEFLFDCGITIRSDTAKLSEKESVVSALCHHFLIAHVVAEVEQLRKGLNTLYFLELMEQFPEKLMPVFRPTNVSLTAETLEDLFDIKYAEEGSNRRVTEEQIVFNLFKLF